MRQDLTRYDIDLLGRRKPSTSIRPPALDGLKQMISSTPVIAACIAAVLGCLAYFVFVPLIRAPAVREGEIEEMRHEQAALQAQREGLLQEAKVIIQIKAQAPGWATILEAIGAYVPSEIWLRRIALEEDRSNLPRNVAAAGQQPQVEPVRRFLVIEGLVDTGKNTSPLEPISGYMEKLQNDERIQRVLTSLNMVSSRATEEDPGILAFKLRGPWSPEASSGKMEDLIQAGLGAQTPKAGEEGS